MANLELNSDSKKNVISFNSYFVELYFTILILVGLFTFSYYGFYLLPIGKKKKKKIPEIKSYIFFMDFFIFLTIVSYSF